MKMIYQVQNREEIKRQIGHLGEQLVHSLLPGSIPSKDWFDEEKDLIFNNNTIEIKTMMKILKYSEYWLDVNQTKKINSVDWLLIVDIPFDRNLIYNNMTSVYIVNKNKLKIEERYSSGSFSKKIIIPDCALLLYRDIKDEKVGQIINLSNQLSSFRRNMY